jgi:hypothetical protein
VKYRFDPWGGGRLPPRRSHEFVWYKIGRRGGILRSKRGPFFSREASPAAASTAAVSVVRPGAEFRSVAPRAVVRLVRGAP